MRLAILLFVLLLIDIYAFQSLKFVIKNLSPIQVRLWICIYWMVSIFCFGTILLANVTDWHQWPKAFRTYCFAIVFIVFISKLVVDVFLIIDDAGRAIRWVVSKFQKDEITGGNKISRSEFLVKTGLVIGSIPFFSLIYGMVSGAYNYRTRKVKLKHAGIPNAFNGLRIVQISDLHTGSFHSTEPLEKAVSIINNLKPDVVFFTGDLVNDRYHEVLPYVEVLQKIKPSIGVYSVFGNHDYGDYTRWPGEEEKMLNRQKLKDVHKTLGWKLLWDEHIHIEKDNDRITLVGVQNWSGRAGFQRYGSIEKATSSIQYSSFNILLSHDPSHWRAQITDTYKDIHLTLSGHTHGMQFGIEIPGFKWSPAQYFYNEWAGLYQNNDQFLYVNRGLGFIGYPGRVGILPEITLIELEKA